MKKFFEEPVLVIKKVTGNIVMSTVDVETPWEEGWGEEIVNP